MGDLAIQESVVESGRARVEDKTKFQRNAMQANRSFNIRQGFRRRHPQSVLHQFQGIDMSTEHANSAWERALLKEDERVDIPEEYRSVDIQGIATQLGTVKTARENFKKSFPKLSDTWLVF